MHVGVIDGPFDAEMVVLASGTMPFDPSTQSDHHYGSCYQHFHLAYSGLLQSRCKTGGK